ncbi:MAG: hypothetical protein Q7T61_01105 [Caulobacter sp.]|nr:hypothetical protein [Caulobacter sp.]
MPATAHTKEVLADAFTGLARIDPQVDPVAFVMAESRLVDACIQAGMAHDEPGYHVWAATRVAKWWA